MSKPEDTDTDPEDAEELTDLLVPESDGHSEARCRECGESVMQCHRAPSSGFVGDCSQHLPLCMFNYHD